MELLAAYWSNAELVTNGILLLHLVGAAAVGLLLGYERSYHGRAAGMRTYALVCVASTLLTAINGFPSHWYGGMATTPSAADPTRVIQGLMTGIGFLGAGVIVKDGFTIRGVSTAASIWMTSAIGIIIGIGFYGAALSATALSLMAMTLLGKIEKWLPHQTMLHLSIVYPQGMVPTSAELMECMGAYGFEIMDWSYEYREASRQFHFDLVLRANGPFETALMARDLSKAQDVVEFRLAPSRV
ncbi:MgtC/SapB family protein [Bradyrhizobium sp. BR13661]|jgi:putative Mg2+ transporter-C (MgtC) family protein|uniref:MgtC/SapB family protein n=1 Tax=Bradyrhizobium sp. BR13661 TaxID=2940622 RepID=UPI002473284D|nr:MgtC/SapB family protein [Bradyrhizobium sp. BR13661]MDH6261388.1 putative Mg2+ transporter-C (MgtC) family protein [Bradyrhizobium sp. BR13661]